MRSNLWSRRDQASAIAVVLLSMDTLRSTADSSLPGTLIGLGELVLNFHKGQADVLGVVDSELESGRAPLDEVERGLGLQRSSGSSAVARNDVTTVQKGDSHVLSVARVAHNHLVVGLEA
jgi:hypothetical protein